MSTSTQSSGVFFNAHHAPVGAFATFTLGERGPRGGLGLELGGPANESLFIGAESADGSGYEALPFFANSADAALRYDVSAGTQAAPGLVRPFADTALARDFALATDTWRAGDLTFTVYSAPKPVPDPARASAAALKTALVPAVFAELTLDNRHGTGARTVFFGYEGSNPFASMRRLDADARGKFTGIGQGVNTAIVSDSPGVRSGQGFTLDQILRPDREENLTFGLGGTAALLATVPAGKRRTFRFAICFHREGIVTSGVPARYYYTRFFPSLESVATYALASFDTQRALALAADRRLSAAKLSDDQRFQLAHAVRSYFGSTEFLLTAADEPLWAVNEGEYRMLNTFDLTVDHLFYELRQNPWVVRNQLDWFSRRYAYTDTVRLPGDTRDYPGGLSFTHDMGVANCFSRPRHSSYEKFGLHGCFSHMTHEQLVNWVCCAVSYTRHTSDRAWLKKNLPTFRACLRSLVNRDHPDPRQRDGVMSADSSRCLGGAEITTYDSLDTSLGQARNNLYLAVKTWAAYLGLREVFASTKLAAPAALATRQAGLAAATIARHLNAEGYIPAILGEGNTSRIIPAIEGLVFPQQWGLDDALAPDGPYAGLLAALRTHLDTVFVPGVCLFADGGWKLSSTNDNSWLSKIYLCQFVAPAVFARPADPRADAAHRAWLLDPRNTYFAWSDQMVSGEAKGSKYYPRGVTAWLWLDSVFD
ncbi:MAG: beta-xylosidase [Opitutus sp.]|nr:beta-xylosidase [Opitutus sp.]MCS6246579.1 beta-xylosidase [Opitutus sp.]MCS6272737.1 beta-xylosidase [Opitutus sp.]MCS6276368.1 beta-xylosidase [Opitutus sp.]MCS6301984.1 beta-xylosidase [Opitutus sp.]